MERSLLTLSSGSARLRLAPEIGGAIVDWHVRGAPVLREPLPGALEAGDVRGLASYPLIPYSNRIAWGRFAFGGESHQLDLNFGDHPHSIHGIGWQSPWSVEATLADAAVLSMTHDPAGDGARRWPFAFWAEQRFFLTEDSLKIKLQVENRDHRTAPFGLGLHPYFPRSEGAALGFNASLVWENGSDHLPSRLVPVPPAWNHVRGQRVGSAVIDNCFAAWDRQAEMVFPATGIAVEIQASDIFRNLVVYTPPGRDFFAVEPVSHITDAVNRMDRVGHGLAPLAPGEVLKGEVVFRIGRAR